MPFKTIVVGAGIAGLCATVALRQAGHSVEIFEKSKFSAEIGAALSLCPNGARILRQLGFSFERARARHLKVWESVDGVTLEPLSSIDIEHADEEYGSLMYAVHRVDLHQELLRLASDENDGDRIPAKLHLGSSVTKVYLDKGVVELEDGSMYEGDFVIAADGLRSVIRDAAVVRDVKPVASGCEKTRLWTICSNGSPKEQPSLWIVRENLVMIDVKQCGMVAEDRSLVMFEDNELILCRGDVQNLVGIHPTEHVPNFDGTFFAKDAKDSMLQEFDHYHPDILKLFNLAEEVKCWPLYIHEPLDSWQYGKVLLIGDAAHPMLPIGGQGTNQAIEDAEALGQLMEGLNDATKLPQRLDLFEQVRRKRASRVQTLSKALIGREKEVEEELKRYVDNAADQDTSDANSDENAAVPGSFKERTAHDFKYDVIGECKEVLEQQSSWINTQGCVID
ncbi:hypothetical protein MMC21_005423 [Puttea exsequens]|nr:hypothetical protein [Puttea exsequens]